MGINTGKLREDTGGLREGTGRIRETTGRIQENKRGDGRETGNYGRAPHSVWKRRS